MPTTEESKKQLEYGKLRLSTSPFQLFLQNQAAAGQLKTEPKKDNAK